jgi:hypothetical protein
MFSSSGGSPAPVVRGLGRILESDTESPAFSFSTAQPTGGTVPHKDDQSPAQGPRLTAEEVGARVGAILSDAEREAREIIASARSEGVDAGLPDGAGSFEHLAHALERLSARFDSFELSTAAQIEELGRQLREALAGVAPAAAEPAAPPPRPAAPRQPPPEETAAFAAARVRAIDLALAGYSRDVIANELATSLERTEIEVLLADVLIS